MPAVGMPDVMKWSAARLLLADRTRAEATLQEMLSTLWQHRARIAADRREGLRAGAAQRTIMTEKYAGNSISAARKKLRKRLPPSSSSPSDTP